MAQRSIYLSLDYNTTSYSKPEELAIYPEDTVVFYALKGSSKIKFTNCTNVFVVDCATLENSIHQDSSWETPVFNLGSAVSSPIEFTVQNIGSELSVSKAPSKLIKAVVG